MVFQPRYRQFANYRRPNLIYATSNQVFPEAGLNGISGSCPIIFPDGQMRGDTGVPNGQSTMTITQNAILTGAKQGGLRSTLTATSNTWYAIYAVKSQDDQTTFVIVGDTVLPLQANFSTLNTNYGTNSWVYLGMIRYGDQGSNPNIILDFIQQGNMTYFRNIPTGGSPSGIGIAVSGSVTSLTYSLSQGTSGTSIPNHLNSLIWVGQVFIGVVSNVNALIEHATANLLISAAQVPSNGDWSAQVIVPAAFGLKVASSTSSSIAIWLSGYFDGVLGVGSNPSL